MEFIQYQINQDIASLSLQPFEEELNISIQCINECLKIENVDSFTILNLTFFESTNTSLFYLSKDTNVSISYCNFSLNFNQDGIGSIILVNNSESLNFVSIFNSIFDSNSAMLGGVGGIVESKLNHSSPSILVSSSIFLNNSAEIGGIFYHHIPWKHQLSMMKAPTISYINYENIQSLNSIILEDDYSVCILPSNFRSEILRRNDSNVYLNSQNQATFELTSIFGSNPCYSILVDVKNETFQTQDIIISQNLESLTIQYQDYFGHLLTSSSTSQNGVNQYNDKFITSSKLGIDKWNPFLEDFIDFNMLPKFDSSSSSFSNISISSTCHHFECIYNSTLKIGTPPSNLTLELISQISDYGGKGIYKNVQFVHELNLSYSHNSIGSFISSSFPYEEEDCPVGHFGNISLLIDSCFECQNGQFSNFEGSGQCNDCNCNENGVCSSSTSSKCKCDDFYDGKRCEIQQNLDVSNIFGFTFLIVLMSLLPSLLCSNGMSKISNYIKRTKLHPILLTIYTRYSITLSHLTSNEEVENSRKEIELEEFNQEKRNSFILTSNPILLDNQDLVQENQKDKNSLQSNSISSSSTTTNSNDLINFPPIPTKIQFLSAMGEFILFLIIFIILLLFLYVVELLKVFGNVFLLSRSFYQNDLSKLNLVLEEIGKSLSKLLSIVSLESIGEFFTNFSKILGSFDFSQFAIQQINVTCDGTTAPGTLFLNLLVIVGLICVIDLDLFPFLQMTCSSYINVTKIRWMRGGKSPILIICLGFIIGLSEGLLRYTAQVLASFLTYSTFIPYHPSSKVCDKKGGGSDSILALLSTSIAYLFFLPAAHLVLKIFVPGLPEGVSFKSFSHFFDQDNKSSKIHKDDDVNDEKSIEREHSENLLHFNDDSQFQDSIRVDLENKKNILFLDKLNNKMQSKSTTNFSHSNPLKISTTLRQDENNIPSVREELPSFIHMINIIMYDLFQNKSCKVFSLYVKCLVWKIKILLKITFGYWDQETIQSFNIQYKYEIFKTSFQNEIEDIHDIEKKNKRSSIKAKNNCDYDYLEIVSLKGQSHSLIWQFSHTCVIISKFAEAINESPLFIDPPLNSQNAIFIPPIIQFTSSNNFDENLPTILSFLYSYNEFIDCRFCSCLFETSGFLTEVLIALLPTKSFTILLFYLAFILPNRIHRFQIKYQELNIQFSNLTEVVYYTLWWLSFVPSWISIGFLVLISLIIVGFLT